MRAVSGTSGAAPVWRDVMVALTGEDGGRPIARPPGIEERQISFADSIEQPRREYFLAGTAITRVAGAPAGSRRPRITNPVTGSIYALDPDIPIGRQRLAVGVSGAVAAYRIELDGRDIGAADARPLILPGPGRHRLRLIDTNGRPVDQVVFTIR